MNPQVGRYLRVFCVLFWAVKSNNIEELRSDNMTKIKGTYDYIKEIRGSWVINPRTRVQENEMKNKKKRRQQENKMIKDGMKQ